MYAVYLAGANFILFTKSKYSIISCCVKSTIISSVAQSEDLSKISFSKEPILANNLTAPSFFLSKSGTCVKSQLAKLSFAVKITKNEIDI